MNNTMEVMKAERNFTVEELTKAFEDVKSRTGRGGKNFDYVPWNKVVEQVNKATDNRWSCTIDEIRMIDAIQTNRGGQHPFWLAQVTITIPSMGTRTNVGTKEIDILSNYDAIKSAVSDAIKRTMTLFGIALHLYDNEEEIASTINQPIPSGLPTGGLATAPGQPD